MGKTETHYVPTQRTVIPSDLLNQLLAGGDVAAALQQGGLLDSLKKALAERPLNADMVSVQSEGAPTLRGSAACINLNLSW